MGIHIVQRASGLISNISQTLSFPNITQFGNVVLIMSCFSTYFNPIFPNSDDGGNLYGTTAPVAGNPATTVDGPPATVGSESIFNMAVNPTSHSNYCNPMKTLSFSGIGGGHPTYFWMFEIAGLAQQGTNSTLSATFDAQYFTEQNNGIPQNCLNHSAQNPMYSPAGTTYGGIADTHSQNIQPSNPTLQYLIMTCVAPTTQGGGAANISAVDAPFTLETVQGGFGCAWKVTASGYDPVADRATFHNSSGPAFYSGVWIALQGIFVPTPPNFPAPPGGDHFIKPSSPTAGSVQSIPLDNAPNQTWNVTVQVDGQPVTVTLILRYNEIAKYWVATIFDSKRKLLLDSVPFVTGNGVSQNLLSQFSYLGIGSATVFNASASAQ